MGEITRIEQLVKTLKNLENFESVNEVLAATHLNESEWKKYAFWSKNKSYSRNLIHEEKDTFQLLLICWKPGQGNERHKHLDSKCFFKVLHGKIFEQCYREDDLKADNKYKTGEICHFGDSKKLHSLRNSNKSDMAVTLHLYIKPTSQNLIYNKEGNTVCNLEFISKNGQPIEEDCLPWDSWDDDGTTHNVYPSNYSCPRKMWKPIQNKQFIGTILSLVSLGSSMVVIIVVTLTFTLEKHEDGNKTTVKSLVTFQKVCIQCEKIQDLKEESPDEIFYRKINAEGDNQCCASNEQELSNLFKIILRIKERMDDKKLTSSTGELFYISAHKKLFMSKEVAESHDNSNTHKVLNIDPIFNDPPVEHVRGVDLSSTGIIIRYSGIYFIYSSVLFQQSPMLSTNQTVFHYTHRVSRDKPSLSGVLLRAVLTADKNSVVNEESTFSGGVFYLLSGDIIQICVSFHNSTTVHKELSFIGLTLLSVK